ncbi:hypothetical protein KR52_14205 [Synechococcus sp. KORDI-52]|uniref:hypothetical protein n=1 Tax=Synechococcus sp. KORDI-52 TaxID=585425 RepID=UPI0004E090FD|nr:hypothetical protein [Synechococcus sp. KORDI-52]AII50275.1 hypothetical protein KR52_14205 [Synechococcus sp. KORDI-52]
MHLFLRWVALRHLALSVVEAQHKRYLRLERERLLTSVGTATDERLVERSVGEASRCLEQLKVAAQIFDTPKQNRSFKPVDRQHLTCDIWFSVWKGGWLLNINAITVCCGDSPDFRLILQPED